MVSFLYARDLVREGLGFGKTITIDVCFSFPHSCLLFFPEQYFHAPSSYPKSLTSGLHPGLYFPVKKLLLLSLLPIPSQSLVELQTLRVFRDCISEKATVPPFVSSDYLEKALLLKLIRTKE